MHYDEVKQWHDTKNITPNHIQERGEGYEEFKQRKTEKLIDVVEHRFPDIRKHIVSTHTSTPLTYRDYIGSKDGNLYGMGYLNDKQQQIKSIELVQSSMEPVQDNDYIRNLVLRHATEYPEKCVMF